MPVPRWLISLAVAFGGESFIPRFVRRHELIVRTVVAFVLRETMWEKERRRKRRGEAAAAAAMAVGEREEGMGAKL